MFAKTQVYVLDSFAVLAYLDGEAAAEQVTGLLTQTQNGDCRLLLSLINLGEIMYIIERERGVNKTRQALAAIQQMPLEVLPIDQDEVFHAAHLKASYPIAYSDAFAAAAAQQYQAALVTGDREFESLNGIIPIEWLPRN